MKINKKRIRSLVRKKILEQISGEATDVDKDGVPDGIDRDTGPAIKSSAKVKLEEDPEATKKAKDEFLSQAKLFEDGCAPGVGLSKQMSRQKARELSDRLYEATEGGFLDLGFGTDEDEVQAVFSDPAIQSLVDLSYVAHMYEKNYPGYDIASTLAGEYGYFSSTDFRKNVRDPLEDLLSDSPIFILGEEKYDAEKIAQMKSDAEKFVSDSQELVGRSGGERVLDAGKGVAAASATMGTLQAAGLAYSGGFAGVGYTSTFIAGATGAAPGWAATLPVVGPALALIPGPGWVALGVLAVGSALFMAFDEADFTLQEESMLSPNLYRALNAQFKQAGKDLLDQSSKVSIPFPPDEEAIDGGDTDGGENIYPPLPSNINGLGKNKTECIKKYQGVMNAYASSRKLGYPNIKIDGKVGPETRGMWSKFVKHVFANHSTFSTTSIADVVSSGQVTLWRDISVSLIGTYPGYTKSECGALAFSLDAYYGNVYFGTQQPGEMEPSSAGGSGGSGASAGVVVIGGGQSSKKGGTQTDIDMSMGEKGLKNIIIGVDFNNEVVDNNVGDKLKAKRFKDASLLSDVFPSFNTRLTQRLLDNMKERDFLSGRTGRDVNVDTVYELQVDIKRNGEAKVKKAKEAKTFGNRMGRNFGKLTKVVEQVLNDEFDNKTRIVFDKLRIQIRLESGLYSLSENKVLRKLIRRAITKQLIR